MKIKLSYQPQELPPPFAYAAVLSVDTSGNQMEASLELVYLDRESVSEDELRAEGFTRDDDFSWSGKLHSNWKADIEALSVMDAKEEPDNETYLHVEIDGKPKGFPENIVYANRVFQEILQAILEQSNIESELQIDCIIDSKKHQLKWKFSARVIELDGSPSQKWERGRQMMELIYSMDFDSLKFSKTPGDNGVSFVNGEWYNLPKEAAKDLSSLLSQL